MVRLRDIAHRVVRALRTKKSAKPVRTAAEFRTTARAAAARAPYNGSAAYSWDLTEIMSARDRQLSGDFRTPVRLAESMRTDDAIYVAQENRLAPAQMIGVALEPAKGARAKAITAEADALFGPNGIALSKETMSAIRLDYIDHGVAVGVLHWTPRADGSRLDVELRHWPLEHVWWHEHDQCLMTRVYQGSAATGLTPYQQTPIPGNMPVVHGDGRWVIFSKSETLPWRKQAALLPAAMVWARHAFAARDWAKGSAAHGNAKVIGTLPEEVSLQYTNPDTGDVETSPEASDFLDMCIDIASLESPVGIKPFGSTVDYLVNTSQAWQVWQELLSNAERAAARIYMGTDGFLGAQGGAPGVDVQALFGVSRTRVEGDLACEERAIRTGVIEPWTAVNFGDSSLAPTRRHLIPDSDADADRESLQKRVAAFWEAMAAAVEAGSLTRDYVETMAERYDVPAPDGLGANQILDTRREDESSDDTSGLREAV